jgi:hypothetical protein
VKCLLSEAPDFPVEPGVANDTYLVCLKNLSKSDIMILLLRSRYGTSDISTPTGLISIVHQEYRTAVEKRIPIFPFVHQDTWDAYKVWQAGHDQFIIAHDQVRLFDLIREVEGNPRKWLFFFENTDVIKKALTTNFFSFDESKFVADVTFPGGEIVKAGERFKKVWEIQNAGMVTWEGRFLKEENPGVSGLVS